MNHGRFIHFDLALLLFIYVSIKAYLNFYLPMRGDGNHFGITDNNKEIKLRLGLKLLLLSQEEN